MGIHESHGERIASLESRMDSTEKAADVMITRFDGIVTKQEKLAEKLYYIMGGFAVVSIGIQVWAALKH